MNENSCVFRKRREIKRKTCPLKDSWMGRRPAKAFNYNFFNALFFWKAYTLVLTIFCIFQPNNIIYINGLNPNQNYSEKTGKTCKKENHVFSLQAAGEKNSVLTIGLNCHIADIIRYIVRIYVSTHKIQI